MKLLNINLQAFFITARLGTVHAAANELHLTQTAVTQRIKNLENQLKTSLFMRSRKGMTLTKEGESLLRYCFSFLELERETIISVAKTGIEKNISLCITGPTTIMRSRIIPQCTKTMKKFPNVSVQFDINDSVNRTHSLQTGISQFAILEQNSLSEEMHYKKLEPENYILVSSAKWKGRSLKKIIKTEKIIDFDLQDQMTFNYLKQYDFFDMAKKERHFVNRTDILAYLIENELGYGVLPEEFAKPYIKNKKFIVLNKGKMYPYSLVLAWYPRHYQPPYFKHFIDVCC